MWLWKKFWHTDIIGKIYILVILFIIVVATITVITRYKNASTNQNVNEQNNQVNEVIDDKTTSDLDVEEENIVTAVNLGENKEEKIEQQNKQEEVKESVQAKSDSKVKQEKVTTNNSSSTSSLPNKTESKVTKETENKQTEIKETKEEVKQQTKEEQNTKENVVQEEKTSVPKEEYKVNNAMINTMKNYIQNNPSENMKAYGFEIVVDSSIAEQTSQFTYSEQRMKDKINLRFGTIRIYALDYYCNGNLVMTECFIL